MQGKLKSAHVSRAQAAMEYLMTYGWSILIIAVILGSLAYLGVFNPNTYAPRAPPGSCKVFRAGGNVNLEGICNGELPQYSAQFNGANSYVSSPDEPTINLGNSNSMTMSLWVYLYNSFSGYTFLLEKETPGYDIAIFPSGVIYSEVYHPNWGTNGYSSVTGSVVLQSNKWYNVVTVFNQGQYFNIYINGVLDTSSTAKNFPVGSSTSPLQFGVPGWWSNNVYLNGRMANVQIYNASLDANSVMALYKEGIGGAPINTANIVGWWPLNGDSNDYSGNGNNGVPTNVAFTNQWLNGYSAPPH